MQAMIINFIEYSPLLCVIALCTSYILFVLHLTTCQENMYLYFYCFANKETRAQKNCIIFYCHEVTRSQCLVLPEPSVLD